MVIPVAIESLAIGFLPGSSMISLRVKDDSSEEFADRSLPIVVGPIEATSIAAALDEKPQDRPLTHQLMLNTIASMGGEVTRVVIDRVKDTTFYATLYVRTFSGMFVRIDARPSDAIALAATKKIPLYAESSVLQAASVPSSFKPGTEKKIEMEEFHKFIENITPEDFVADKHDE